MHVYKGLDWKADVMHVVKKKIQKMDMLQGVQREFLGSSQA